MSEDARAGVNRSYAVPILYPDGRIDLSQVVDLAQGNHDVERARIRAERLVAAAAKRLRIRDDPHDLVIRSLSSADVSGVAGWQTPPLIYGQRNVILRHLVPVDVCLGVYGIFDLSDVPVVTEVTLAVGSAATQVRGVYDLAAMCALPARFALFSDPVLYVRTEVLHVSVQVRLASFSGSLFGLAGVLCEPIGMTVSAPAVSEEEYEALMAQGEAHLEES